MNESKSGTRILGEEKNGKWHLTPSAMKVLRQSVQAYGPLRHIPPYSQEFDNVIFAARLPGAIESASRSFFPSTPLVDVLPLLGILSVVGFAVAFSALFGFIRSFGT